VEIEENCERFAASTKMKFLSFRYLFGCFQRFVSTLWLLNSFFSCDKLIPERLRLKIVKFLRARENEFPMFMEALILKITC